MFRFLGIMLDPSKPSRNLPFRSTSCIVPKKPNEMKADLLNSTVSQDDQLGGLSLDSY